MNDSYWAELGQVVRGAREARGLTQDQLGRGAGYGAGAGVSISRLENGQLRPGDERVSKIAGALGLTHDELDVLVEERLGGSSTAMSQPATETESDEDASARSSGRAIRDRARKIEKEINRRTSVITELGEAFNFQHDRARDLFFMRFVEIGHRVQGAPPFDANTDLDDDSTEPDAIASYRLHANASGVGQLIAGGAGGAAAGAAVGGVAAYGTFVAVASLGTASTGAAITSLSGVAATNATLAVLGGGTLAAGGAGIAGGTMVLAGIVAAPAVLLAAGGLLWMAKRNRRQQQELATKLAAAEAELEASRPGMEALVELLPTATGVLEYIATHAGHAVSRWDSQLGPNTIAWDSLSESDRLRYQQFVDIAAAQLALVTINVQGLLTTSGDERDLLIEFADEVLTQAKSKVAAYV